MTKKYLDDNGLLYLWQKIRNTFVSDVTWDSTNKKLVKKKKTGTNGAEQSTDLVTFGAAAISNSYNDLSNKPTIPTLKYVFGKVKVGNDLIEADNTQATLEFESGDHISLIADTANDKVTISGEAGAFFAEYGTTTYAEISAAIADEQSVFLTFSGTNSYLDDLVGVLSETNANGHTFAVNHFENGAGFSLTLVVCDDNDEWGIDGITIADTSTATTSADGLMSSTDKSKLDGIATGAEVNVQSDWSQSDSTADDYIKNKPTIPTLKNVFGKIKVGSTTIEADTTQDTLELAAGINIALTADTTNDKVTIEGDPKVFIAYYGTTTFTEIFDALSAGKEVIVQREYSSITSYAQLTFYSASEIYFSCYQRLNTGLNQALWFKITSSGAWSSGGKEIVTLDGTQSLTNKSYNGYTLADACAKGVVTSISADSTDLPTVTAVKNYVSTAITGAAAFQGTAPTTFAPTNYKKGWYWVVGTAGTYCGQTCEAGDMIFATSDYSSAYSASDFDVIQTNLDITDITNAEIDTIVAS